MTSDLLTRTKLKHWEMTRKKMKRRLRRKRGIEIMEIDENEVQSMCTKRTLGHFSLLD